MMCSVYTFLDYRWQSLSLGVDYCVDEVIPPVPGHIQCRMPILVLLVYTCSVRVCVCARVYLCVFVCVEEKRKRWMLLEECEVELEEVRRLWP